ncbi:DNA-3-methyladenine glycosylase family protein [Sinomonas flava]|uniref:DNA-3-methyladenine glycosylase family protein n=1 Tax=Sinomonas flava TaxID=496857 RepID=UPI0039A457B6
MAAHAGPQRTRVRLDARGGMEPEAIVASLAAHTVPGAERTDVEAFAHERLVPTGLGPVAVRVWFDRDGAEVALGTEDPAAVAAALASIERWLDLSADLEPVRRALGGDPDLGPCVRARPALRVIGTTDPFQTAVTTVLGQQVSLGAARTFAGRLVAAFGTPGPAGLVSFPTAEALADQDTETLRVAVGLTAVRARTVSALARAVATAHDTGRQSADSTGAEGSARPALPGILPLSRAELLALPGIGPWTADYLEVRYGHRDAFTPGDLVLRRALGGLSAREAAERARAWSPFRAYALTHLWTASAYGVHVPVRLGLGARASGPGPLPS